MKYSLALIAGLGLAAASHAGHERFHRRADVDTVTDWTIVTVTDVVTVYGPSPVAEPTSAAAPVKPSSVAAAASPSKAPEAPPAPPAPVKQSSAAQSPAAQSPAAQSPAETPAAQSPAAQSPAAAPTTMITSAVPKPAAPNTPSAPAAPASSSAAPAAGSSSPSSGGSGAGQFGMMAGASIAANCGKDAPCEGDMTTYTPGQGSCGYDDSTGEHKDDAVALQIGMFGTVTNIGVNQPSNKLCNKKIQIVDKTTGQSAVGVIRDACPGCSHPDKPNGAGIDLAPALMSKLLGGKPADGRLPIEWYFMD